MLASRSVNPWFTALSAVASNNSGFMFIGLIGTTYAAGLSSMWIMVGWVAGDYLTWLFFAKKLRETSDSVAVNTIPGYMAGRGVNELAGRKAEPIAIVAGLIVFIFLGVYAAAQLGAGSKALHALFGWPFWVGAVIGAVIIVVYCFSGGIRASIWTDTAQSVVMIGAMFVLVGAAVVEGGGMGALWDKLHAIDPNLTKVIPTDQKYGFTLYAFGWLAAGIGVVGQPHIMIRAMAIRSSEEVAKARRIYIAWYIFFAAACIAVGLACRVLLPEVANFDQELALPRLSQQLLPEVLVGLVLAGLFAATMSTADSQVLSCSASLTQDIVPKWQHSYMMTKIGTLVVAAMALLIALFGKSIFDTVTFAWSALASGLGPVMLVRILKKPLTQRLGVATMLAGIGTVLVWRFVLELQGEIYDVLPGMLAGTIVYIVGRQFIGTAQRRTTARG